MVFVKNNSGNHSLLKLSGIVERITYHNPENGWSVIKLSPFGEGGKLVTVVIHQAKVFAGATMEFWGHYTNHPKHGEQFKAEQAIEKKPATVHALERYIGSGLIKGVGPAIAKRIVQHFKDDTLNVFETNMEKLMLVPGIAEKKLKTIQSSWEEHRAIRDVMMFLQNFGISTLFATKIYKHYGDRAIATISENPYRLAEDIYGIGFFSADQIALSMGFDRSGSLRIEAGLTHVLNASRDEGHCYLTKSQILKALPELLREKIPDDKILLGLKNQEQKKLIKTRLLAVPPSQGAAPPSRHYETCYYAKGLYYDEEYLAEAFSRLSRAKRKVDSERIHKWVSKYCEQKSINLSSEQLAAVLEIPKNGFSILTGGPGCGKTTTTRVLVQLLLAMQKKVLLAAPTGRAAQRMSEVIGYQASTIHRLLEWQPHLGRFKRGPDTPLECDFLVLDECSMLDVHLCAELLKAVPTGGQILFIGDPDQLPAVGAGNVLCDLLQVAASLVPRYQLTQIFRQAQASSIIRYAHNINKGILPKIPSPVKDAELFSSGQDCLFVDSDEATQEQLKFIRQAKFILNQAHEGTVLVEKKAKQQAPLTTTKVTTIGEEEVVHSAGGAESPGPQIPPAEDSLKANSPPTKLVNYSTYNRQLGVLKALNDPSESTQPFSAFINPNENAVKMNSVNPHVFAPKQQLSSNNERWEIQENPHQQDRESQDLWHDKLNTAGGEELTKQNLTAPLLVIPEKFSHVELRALDLARTSAEELASVLKRIHPWSTLYYGLTASDTLLHFYLKTIPEYFKGQKVEIQVLCPQVRGSMGTQQLNSKLQEVSNPARSDKPEIRFGEKILRFGDRVIQTRNNYDLGVFNGDIGKITKIHAGDMMLEVSMGNQKESRVVIYNKEDLMDLNLAYAITIHKSQGSEFEVVILPILGQHFNMLFRNLIYTGLTRAKKLALFIGNRKALALATQAVHAKNRQTALKELIENRLAF